MPGAVRPTSNWEKEYYDVDREVEEKIINKNRKQRYIGEDQESQKLSLFN